MTVIVFPGQGSQFVEMGKDFYDSFQEVKDTFDLISDVSKIDIKDIIFNNPSDILHQTQFTQISIFTVSISYDDNQGCIGKLTIESTTASVLLNPSEPIFTLSR